MRTILESIADGVVVVTDDNIVRYVNPAAAALLGQPASAIIGTSFGHPLTNAEIDLSDSPDIRMICEMRVEPTEWEGNTARVAVIRDMSARKRARMLERELLASDRRTAIAQLAANVAHEINNPTAFILANLTVMKDIVEEFDRLFQEVRLSRTLTEKYQVAQSIDDMREMLKDNELGLSRIRSFVRELRGLSQEPSGPIELVDINEVVALACAMAVLTPRVRLHQRLGDVPSIAGDRMRLTQAVFHLIDNAARAAGQEREGGEVEVSTYTEDSWVIISVSDNGCGIPAENLDRIFEPFFIANPGRNGIGLGLPIASEIAASHSGRIEVDSELDHGSRFRLMIPRETGLAVRDPRKDTAPGHVRARVLLVADDAHLGRRIRELLASLHDVVDAGGSQRALAHVAHDADYDVILCDAAMDMDVRVFYAELSQQAPRLAGRLVFISDDGSPAKTRRFLESTRSLLLEKPLSRTVLCEVIERVSR